MGTEEASEAFLLGCVLVNLSLRLRRACGERFQLLTLGFRRSAGLG